MLASRKPPGYPCIHAVCPGCYRGRAEKIGNPGWALRETIGEKVPPPAHWYMGIPRVAVAARQGTVTVMARKRKLTARRLLGHTRSRPKRMRQEHQETQGRRRDSRGDE